MAIYKLLFGDDMGSTIRSFFNSTPSVEKIDETNFRSNGILTLGAEVELQIIDPESFKLIPKAEEILNHSLADEKIKPELYLSTVEINSNKCDNAFEIEKDLNESFDLITKIANDVGLRLATTGCHPFSRYSDCLITQTVRYNELIDRNQWLTRRMTVYGLHVHIGMKSGDDAIRFNNFFLNFIPHLLALSASSPFWQAEDTGLASCRPTTYESLPTAGSPYQVKNWLEFENLYASLKKCKAINSLRDLWWDIRPSPSYGTIEIRVCDGLATLEETMAIIAFIHLLANWFNDHGSWLEQVPVRPVWLSRENKWRVIRHGLEADLITNVDGSTKSIKKDILEWIEKLEIYSDKLGYQKYIISLKNIVEKGNGSTRQRKVFAQTNSLEEVVKSNIEEFLAKKPNW